MRRWSCAGCRFLVLDIPYLCIRRDCVGEFRSCSWLPPVCRCWCGGCASWEWTASIPITSRRRLWVSWSRWNQPHESRRSVRCLPLPLPIWITRPVLISSTRVMYLRFLPRYTSSMAMCWTFLRLNDLYFRRRCVLWISLTVSRLNPVSSAASWMDIMWQRSITNRFSNLV